MTNDTGRDYRHEVEKKIARTRELEQRGFWYDTARICLNGHFTNMSVEMRPEDNKNFCDRCGEKTLKTCPSCDNNIRGSYYNGSSLLWGVRRLPLFCPNCGKPYPWQELIINASIELIKEIEQLSDEEKDTLVKSIEDIVKESPRQTAAVMNFKKLMPKIGKEVYDGLKSILIDVISETLRKSIFPK